MDVNCHGGTGVTPYGSTQLCCLPLLLSLLDGIIFQRQFTPKPLPHFLLLESYTQAKIEIRVAFAFTATTAAVATATTTTDTISIHVRCESVFTTLLPQHPK